MTGGNGFHGFAAKTPPAAPEGRHCRLYGLFSVPLQSIAVYCSFWARLRRASVEIGLPPEVGGPSSRPDHGFASVVAAHVAIDDEDVRSLTGPSSLAHTCRLTIASAISRSHSRPNCALKAQAREKTRGKSTKKWRRMALFRGAKAPFCGAPSRLHSIATRPPARPYVHGARLPRAASGPPNLPWGAIFRRPGHETTYVGRGRFDDCADSVARLGRPGR
jgi:hypothetical protein